MLDTPRPRTRSGGRSARRAARSAPVFDMLPGLERNIPVCEVMDGSQVERIHNASMDILENVGVQFRDPIALEDWKRIGAKVVGELVYLDRALVMDLISTIPADFTYNARDPKKNVRLGGKHSIFVPMTGAPFLRDLDDVRRNPTLDDLAMFHKLAHMSPALHSSAHHIVEPYDHPISQRHLQITYSSMKYSDKTFMGMTTSPKNAEDVMDMCAILFGDDFIENNPVTTGNCNGNSPLVWDETMLGAMRAFCKRNQPVLCSPFVLGGANTPASVAASVAQLNAEALSALAYTQVIRRGAPAIYGHYLSTVSMKSGAPMAGTPEISLMNFMIGQMARYYDVPWRTSNTLGGAKTFDAQAGYESATTLSAVIHAGANYIWHSAGWNEAGMHCSVAKFIVDTEQCAMAYRMAQGPNWDDFDAALAAVPDVGPGGHYLGHPHTQDNFQTAFFMPELFDNNSIEQWVAEGSVEITERALNRARKLLQDYEEPKLDIAKDEGLRDYIARREREIPASDELNQEY
ncbi:trimethylamine methyltransferase family protein [Shimia thalassica]|uniref:trimethylamine methyltransferase family protein n=1 Tax=Shimia thalassica TaxID=1715693 RepID=UPI001C08A78E|nr:trimethylamine methyltransferase family protein [Shimia thalassica]MBU2944842.1 trimethylamine methyltransferase family protein [Shimia thalassica]MDO6504853.1 trimethylamine methyltransferase family protein [Shimia thalassica]MDO6799956.1 trimethylamine methyltransferase family protein [Shimia thalassica]